MRLVIVWPDRQKASTVCEEMEQEGWEVSIHADGRKLPSFQGETDLLLLHLCLPWKDGLSLGRNLVQIQPLRPPRILFAAPPEWCSQRPGWADCMVDSSVCSAQLCALLRILSQKPLPAMAAVNRERIAECVHAYLNELGFHPRSKGRACTAWLLEQLVPATEGTTLLLKQLYAVCAQTFNTTPQAVERCVRSAVESAFTRGRLDGINRFFGATVDPERGKPTNRAFLMHSAQQLRYSFTASRSPNSSEMHHSPAAPTSV